MGRDVLGVWYCIDVEAVVVCVRGWMGGWMGHGGSIVCYQRTVPRSYACSLPKGSSSVIKGALWW